MAHYDDKDKNPYHTQRLTHALIDRLNEKIQELCEGDTVKYDVGAVYIKPKHFNNLRTFVRVHAPANSISDEQYAVAKQQANRTIEELQKKLEGLGITSTITRDKPDTHINFDKKTQTSKTIYFTMFDLHINPEAQEGGLSGFMQLLESRVVSKRMKEISVCGNPEVAEIEEAIRATVRKELKGEVEKSR